MKQNLLVSFSGGETSAYMAHWLWVNCQERFNMVFVFANTSQENYETIQFIRKCAEYFDIKIHCVEAVVHHGIRKANTHKVVNIWDASMDGEVFEEIIKKHGIPNQNFPHCTRELKTNPIKSFGKEYFNGEPYFTAIGIRVDEIDRISANHKENKIIYPLLQKEFIPSTKKMINEFWRNQPFRLELKGYQGNCITCWKKSDKKLLQISKENPHALNFFSLMESKYGHFTPESRLKLIESRGELPKYPITFFRGNRSAYDMFMLSKDFDGNVSDDSQEYDSESCEVFSECFNN